MGVEKEPNNPMSRTLTRHHVGYLSDRRHYALMKKFAILGFLALAIIAILLWQWLYYPSDDQIRRRIVGVWSLDSDPMKVIENRADGSYVVKRSGIETVKGTWQVKNGYAIGTVTNASRQDGNFQVESNRVLRVFGDKMVVLSIDGHTQLTCHRQ